MRKCFSLSVDLDYPMLMHCCISFFAELRGLFFGLFFVCEDHRSGMERNAGRVHRLILFSWCWRTGCEQEMESAWPSMPWHGWLSSTCGIKIPDWKSQTLGIKTDDRLFCTLSFVGHRASGGGRVSRGPRFVPFWGCSDCGHLRVATTNSSVSYPVYYTSFLVFPSLLKRLVNCHTLASVVLLSLFYFLGRISSTS